MEQIDQATYMRPDLRRNILNPREPRMTDVIDELCQLRDITSFISDVVGCRTDLTTEGVSGMCYVLWHLRDGLVNVGQALDNLHKAQSTDLERQGIDVNVFEELCKRYGDIEMKGAKFERIGGNMYQVLTRAAMTEVVEHLKETAQSQPANS
ncbi:MAG: hypothetical protein HQK99_16775 [Nitrospirae bacterium]|nr:hypothetical protein [Nitrospirota bacterium]